MDSAKGRSGRQPSPFDEVRAELRRKFICTIGSIIRSANIQWEPRDWATPQWGVTNFELAEISTELVHPKLRSSDQADLCPLANRGGLIVMYKSVVFLLAIALAIPAFSAQRVTVRPRSMTDCATLASRILATCGL